MDGPLPDSDDDAPVKLASLLVIGLGLTALFLGFEWFWIVFAVGFAVLVPAAKILTDQGERENEAAGTPDGVNADSRREHHSDRLGADAPESKRDALDALRNRYAAGELGDAEFERKVERLLETETLEGARHVARGSERADRSESERADRSESDRRDRSESDRGDRSEGRPARDAGGSQRDRDRATER